MEVKEAFRWLEDADSPQTRAWIEAQSKSTNAFLDQFPGREALRNRISQLYDYDRYPSVTTEDGARAGSSAAAAASSIFASADSQNQPVLFVKDPGSANARCSTPTRSPRRHRGRQHLLRLPRWPWLAYAIAEAGSDWRHLARPRRRHRPRSARRPQVV